MVEIYKLTLQALSDKLNVYMSRCGWAENKNVEESLVLAAFLEEAVEGRT